MEISGKKVSVHCGGSKRNFDVAFLSGENEIDKDGKKKEREREKRDEELERRTQEEESPVGRSFLIRIS